MTQHAHPPSSKTPQRLYILTGEASGDLHAARVLAALRQQKPDVVVRGMGGDAMQAEGATLVEHIRNTSIMGFAEVLRRLGFIRRLFRRVQADILAFNPDRILIVDYPGFNLRMARWARQQGIAVDMFIGPQVWAWKRRRIHSMARDLDRLSVILPFEPAHYAEVDLQVEYVGHPLMGTEVQDAVDGEAWRAQHGIPSGVPLLAVLPGSRLQEIQRMLPVLESAAQAFPDHQPVIAGAPGRSPADYPTDLPLVFGETHTLFHLAKAGWVTSGTATLEAALAGMPQVVAYRTSPLTYRLAKAFSRVQFISLVNLILDREAVTELVQGACTPSRLTDAMSHRLSPEGQAEAEAAYAELRDTLSAGGAAAKVAKSLLRPL